VTNPISHFGLTDRVAVVTGASDGIGRDLACGLARAGADIVLCSRSIEKLERVKAEIEQLGQRAESCSLDVCKLDDLRRLRTFIIDHFGRVDILVNAAGFTVTKPAWDVEEAELDMMFDTGFKGLFFCCQIVGSIMRERGYGKIINLGSTFSRSIIKGRSVYGGVKAGVSHLTEALALEWGEHGIRVNALAPTAVLTPSRSTLLQGDFLKGILARIPLGRLATADDLTNAAVYLSSPASDFVTGHTLFVDGGWVAAS
jgi:NAD(P)-dependent dehydrogenase (short-subunit alcohol dehydrogenase family)